MSNLKKDFQYYLDNQEEIVKKYKGKYIVIKDQTIVGIYDNELEAYTESTKQFELGSFLIQECQPGEDNYTQTYHTRVIYNG